MMHLIGERICRGCGCTDGRACPGGCAWVLLDVRTPTGVCSECAEEMEWEPEVLAYATCDVAAKIMLPYLRAADLERAAVEEELIGNAERFLDAMGEEI